MKRICEVEVCELVLYVTMFMREMELLLQGKFPHLKTEKDQKIELIKIEGSSFASITYLSGDKDETLRIVVT